MPRYSAPGAIRRCHMPPLEFREPVPTYRQGACAARPLRPGTAERRLARAGLSPGSWEDGDRPFRGARTGRRLVPCCRQRSWPSAGSTSTPCPCRESRRSPGQAPSRGPCPNRPQSSASAADRFSGPLLRRRRRCRARRATCRRHLSAGISPRRSPKAARCGPVTRPAGPAPYRISREFRFR